MSLKLFCKGLRIRTQKNWDAVVAVTGEEGVGKSVFGVKVGKETDNRFKIEKNEIYSTDVKELESKIMQLPAGSVIVADEAIKILYKYQWASRGQKFINKLYALARKERKITLLCIPRFSDLNEFFRNHRVKFWVHILDRGTAIVFVRDWSPFAKDPWWMNENQKIIDKYTSKKKIADIGTPLKMKILAKSKNYLMDIEFEDFTPEEREVYHREISAKKFEGVDDDGKDDPMRQRDLIHMEREAKLAFALVKQGFSFLQVSEETGIPRATLHDYMVRFAIPYHDYINNKGVGGKTSKLSTQEHKQHKVFLPQVDEPRNQDENNNTKVNETKEQDNGNTMEQTEQVEG